MHAEVIFNSEQATENIMPLHPYITMARLIQLCQKRWNNI